MHWSTEALLSSIWIWQNKGNRKDIVNEVPMFNPRGLRELIFQEALDPVKIKFQCVFKVSKLKTFQRLSMSIESREQITRNKPFIIVCKQRPFRFESCRNRESRLNNRESSLDSRFSRGSRIKCQLTFERYCTLHCSNLPYASLTYS